jgi:RNA polymerase sigma-70 factor, ECF subfamily
VDTNPAIARQPDAPSELAELVRLHQRSMTRLARHYVRDAATAEEVVQETWLAVLRGMSGFEGRGSLKNWIYAILVNLAKARGKREARVLPVAFDSDSPLHSVTNTVPSVEERACDRELLALIVAEIGALPISQRAVIYLRDIRGLSPDEVCEILSISDGAQRVHLHRARSRVRAAIARYLGTEVPYSRGD